MAVFGLLASQLCPLLLFLPLPVTVCSVSFYSVPSLSSLPAPHLLIIVRILGSWSVSVAISTYVLETFWNFLTAFEGFRHISWNGQRYGSRFQSSIKITLFWDTLHHTVPKILAKVNHWDFEGGNVMRRTEAKIEGKECGTKIKHASLKTWE